ncbi:MAG: ATP-binding protein [Nitrospirota bacterium]
MKELTLVQRFSLISLIAMIIAGTVIGWFITRSLENNIVMRTKELSAEFISGELSKELPVLDLSIPKKEQDYNSFSQIAKHLTLGAHIVQIKIWNRDKVVVWSTEKELVGQRFPDNKELNNALEGETVSEISRLNKAEQKFERRFERLLELYVPFGFDENGNAQNVFEIYQNLDPLYIDIKKQQKIVWGLTVGCFSFLYVVLYGIVRNASNRINAQSEEILRSYNIIEKAKREWEESFDTINDAITIHDNDFNIVRANKAAERILGLSFLKILSQKCFQSYHGTDCPPEGCPSCQTLKTGKPSTTEIFEPNLNKYLEIKAIPRFDKDNNITGLIHIVRDITEQKKLEDQFRHAQKMEAVGTLAGGIAHDFNNILNVIIGYGDIIQRSLGEDNALKAHIGEVLTAAERAANLTHGLLAFSRKQIIDTRPVNVNDIVNGVKKILSRIIGEDIDFSSRIYEKEIIIKADYSQIEQVLMNLATNARDAMPDGGLFIIETGLVELDNNFIQAHGYGYPGLYALISVTDTGIGMDAKTKEKIFEPFFTTKEFGKGTGLGLATAYGIIKQHNGYINIYSEVGEGTTFKIYLPAIESKAEDVESAVSHPVQGGSEIILAAEDDEAVRKLSRSVLEQFGYRVIIAEDGEDALNKFMENKDRIQLLLLDIIMPKKNGKEVYEEIRKVSPGIKTLFISGYTADLLHKKGILDEGINFISKPVSVNELLTKVREVLDK